MRDECEYEGKLYTRKNKKWTDENHMVAPLYLQHILNTLTFEDADLLYMSYAEAKQLGDKFKASESYQYAIKYYEQAIEKANNRAQIASILPRITSCYRKNGMPRKVITLLASVKDTYGESIINEALLTSAAAAYCDLDEPENAIRCCRWAYRVLKTNTDEGSIELSNVFERANKMLHPNDSNENPYEEEKWYNEICDY